MPALKKASEKKLAVRTPKPPTAARMVEDIIGCKWSLTVLSLVRSGVKRPGAMQRRVEGLTAKVLNERLRKLLRYEIIEREVFAEVPPRVEYRLTDFGKRFGAVIDQITALDAERNRLTTTPYRAQ
ncbi:winged helix-turn-helix transcriptional regulator [Peristeroidobacter agariperforans]|uniref:winged helix-turn-helix transcriptional regulator n=1 Tax=Peristeroidobacter agariperforans TaxID=268404 RepID=UPI00101D248D|nr:helix-turn-helix domain-containing protein [Peristeroidobacter agariperforans]